MNWTLVVTKPARRSLARLPNPDRERILHALDALQADPFSGDIKHLQPPAWRRRIGDYRVFYDLLPGDRLIVVTAIKRRTSTTY
ncbi:MAG: type II toxin-antitoxin system RelE/ParE family toxin [Bryobacteraceae bacterium]